VVGGESGISSLKSLIVSANCAKALCHFDGRLRIGCFAFDGGISGIGSGASNGSDG
jgi:hypothetical protein